MDKDRHTNRFEQGHAYKFTSALSGKKKFRDTKYVYIDKVKGSGGDLFLFMNASGKWRETFTEAQLSAYRIEKAS